MLLLGMSVGTYRPKEPTPPRPPVPPPPRPPRPPVLPLPNKPKDPTNGGGGPPNRGGLPKPNSAGLPKPDFPPLFVPTSGGDDDDDDDDITLGSILDSSVYAITRTPPKQPIDGNQKKDERLDSRENLRKKKRMAAYNRARGITPGATTPSPVSSTGVYFQDDSSIFQKVDEVYTDFKTVFKEGQELLSEDDEDL